MSESAAALRVDDTANDGVEPRFPFGRECGGWRNASAEEREVRMGFGGDSVNCIAPIEMRVMS